MVFDNHDHRIRYVELEFVRDDLSSIPNYTLPKGYRFVFYQHGDRDTWIDIEKSAKEFSSFEQGLESWNRYFGGKEDSLPERMVFIENAEGKKVATATAYYDIYGSDKTGAGWLHWVAVHREYQGRRLARPLIAFTLGLMSGLGYDHAMISSQTNTWLACMLYLDFGFRPDKENLERNYIGWKILKTITHHPALSDIPEAEEMEILNEYDA